MVILQHPIIANSVSIKVMSKTIVYYSSKLIETMCLFLEIPRIMNVPDLSRHYKEKLGERIFGVLMQFSVS